VTPRRAATRRIVATVCCLVALGLGGAACAETNDDSGATTNLDEVGPDLAKLRLEVEQLREEVRRLREQVAVLGPTTTTTAPLR
jgi:hypothetical protein